MAGTLTLRLPQINAADDSTQLTQIRSYLYQMVQELNWALQTVESSLDETEEQKAASASAEAAATEQTSRETFNSIKSLIIKSADIVQAYYEEIDKKLVGEYVGLSDFGTYTQNTQAQITANSEAITQYYNNMQQISGQVNDLISAKLETDAYIKTGVLDYNGQGIPIYGLEVGQTNTVEGVETFNKFARFTSDRLSFYDKNDTEVAYISDFKLFITNAHITGTMQIGGYRIDTTDGLAFIWVGRS